MSNRFKLSLIDMIDKPEPENKLIRRREISRGFEYRFSGIRLPRWFIQRAKDAGQAVIDRDPSRHFSGRTVSIETNHYIPRETA